MSLPYEPETVESMKQRYPEAIKETYYPDLIMMMDDQTDRPGFHRKHVFDFEDGLRMIISKDFMYGSLFIHFSISKLEHNHFYTQWNPLQLREAQQRFRYISDCETAIEMLGISDKGIPHFITRPLEAQINEFLHNKN